MQTRNYAQEVPDMVLYRQNKKTSLGYVQNIHNWTADYNFGTASEMSFEVPKRVYDTRTNSWIDNPNYDNLKPDMLLYLNDETEYFKFTGESCLSDAMYSIKSTGDERKNYELSFDANTAISNFRIQSEAMLFDIGTTAGYEWVWGGFISPLDGEFRDYSEKLDTTADGFSAYQLLGCKAFIPVHKGDIIATKCYEGSSYKFYYKIHYYKDATANSWIKSDNNFYATATARRVYVDFTSYDDNGAVEEDTDTLDEGYIRISIMCAQATYKDNTYKTYIPNASWIQIFSRERLCTYFETTKDELYGVHNTWWIITNTEETNDNGDNSVLKVTAQSYDMVLSKRTFSLSSGTLPLFIPDTINALVTSDYWHWDYYGTTKKRQKFTRGLLNQILDYLPQWRIGYISQAVCTRYRTFDDVDNANIYTFLNTNIASAYQCFFVFDAENMTINVIDGNIDTEETRYFDTAKKHLGTHSRAILTWQNAIKNTNIHTTDDRCINALRVHTANDQYGLGLVNPTGNNTLYNFTNILNELDYVADSNKNRTLRTALTVWGSTHDSYIVDYVKWGTKLIQHNLKKIEQATAVSKALTTYLTVADEINTQLINKYGFNNTPVMDRTYAYQVLVSDVVRKPEALLVSPYTRLCYYSDALYTKLYSAAETYWNTKAEYDSAVEDYNTVYKNMQTIAKELTLNYKTAVQANKDGITTILSPAEILELQNYIAEGDWTNENVVFSDTYSVDDIITTLQGVMTQAKSDHDNYLSKQCYEFEIESANILAIPEMKDNIADLTLGTALSLEVKDGDWQYPVLLSIHINYDDVSDFSMTFNTNYSAKPLKKRFIDCFNTISQTSVRNATFNFTE